MAEPLTGGVRTGRAGDIRLVLQPPLEFILRQAASFRRSLVSDLDDMFERLKPVLGAMEEEQWATKGRGQWPPLAPSTLRSKRGPEMMVESGDLKGSLVDPNEAMHIGAAEAWYGTAVEYAQYHQDGTPRMPQRQVIPDPVPVEVRRELEAKAVGWIDSVAARTFGRI